MRETEICILRISSLAFRSLCAFFDAQLAALLGDSRCRML